MEPGPCGPEIEWTSHSDFTRRMKLPEKQEGVPRKQGDQGPTPMGTAAGKVPMKEPPRRFFGYFLIAQKVTPVPPILKKRNPFPLTAARKTDKMFWQIRKTAWKRRSTRL